MSTVYSGQRGMGGGGEMTDLDMLAFRGRISWFAFSGALLNANLLPFYQGISDTTLAGNFTTNQPIHPGLESHRVEQRAILCELRCSRNLFLCLESHEHIRGYQWRKYGDFIAALHGDNR